MQVRWMIAALFAVGFGACAPAAPPPASAPEVAAAEAIPRFVGQWAVSEVLCDQPAWRFQPEEVSTLGEVHCAFTEIVPQGAGYAIRAMCTAEAPPAPYQIGLDMSENPRAMIVSGGPWMEPTRLVYCAPLPSD